MAAESGVKLVPFDRSFLSAVRSWILDPETRDLVGTVRPPSDGQHERWYEELQSDRRRHVAIIADQRGTPRGIIGLFDIDQVYRKAELWIYVGEAGSRRGGTGRAAVGQMLAFAFDTLGLHRIYVHVFSFNEPGAAFFRSLGFVDEGTERDAVFKRGRFFDVHLLSMLEGDFRAGPRSGKDGADRPPRQRR
ncbi:MAG: GNAT family N-acetyltransferase [Deltaproteobacteria bacterium]|nr:GNAT family N-acetyltransferase [Deltaproteobacteria bacterium]